MLRDIINLDLDWFNSVWLGQRKDAINLFFEKLPKICVLPETIHFFRDHNYVYPWCLSMGTGVRFNIVNIDQHHDFYTLENVDFEDDKSFVHLGNFFAFMAHDLMINNYSWVTNKDSQTGRDGMERNVICALRKAKSHDVQEVENNLKVYSAEQVWNVLRNKAFHGFAIIQSPAYTENMKSVNRWVRSAIKKHLSDKRVVQSVKSDQFRYCDKRLFV